MKWVSVALILSSLAAFSWACCTPDQWEGVQTTFAGYSGYFHSGLIKEYNYVAYDFENKRSAMYMRYVNKDIEAKLKYLVVFDDDEGGMLYIDNLGKGTCFMKKLEGEFRKSCIPKEAKSYGPYYLGLKGGYKVESYNLKGKHMDVIVTVQPIEEDVCAPISELATGLVGHYKILRTVGFVDITPGIKNETVFDVPKDCNEDWSSFDLPLELSREDYFLAV
ncbi:mammalian ependymin-related protein 1-like [Plakobranchus ocellatus]|uniref:Mammalian ependymin-related protein 1-like n=1 Tax=Plakobranchus ocellatus TaxID=259542 RepID=A0AAV4AXF6_9GAST|nr:mammalian ependymin-related protein 1-like [Plakobranchus ocellatus]